MKPIGRNVTRPFCVGLTGGVGCGKSTVAGRFEKLGAEVVDTDRIAHALTAANGAAMSAIIAEFGDEIASPSGELDRARMRTRVFAEPSARKRLEAILHPLIRAESMRQVRCAKGPYVLLVVPLLAENLAVYRSLLNRIAVVDCEEAQQLARTAARPGLDLGMAIAILAAQASPVSRLAIADDLIDNRNDMAALDRQIEYLHVKYLELSRQLSAAR